MGEQTHWRDPHGVVHVVDKPLPDRVVTECGLTVVPQASPGELFQMFHETTNDHPTCLECVVGRVLPVGFYVYEDVGVAYGNIAAIKKISFDDD